MGSEMCIRDRRAVRYQNGYLALICPPDHMDCRGFYLDPTKLEVALTELDNWEHSRNLISDVWSGEVFHIRDEKVWRWDPPNNGLMPLQWRSKEYQLQYEINLGSFSIYWDQARFSSNTINTDLIDADVPVKLLVWANRRLVYEQDIPLDRNGKSMRLPTGFMADIWQFEIRARAPVYSLIVTETQRELRGA